MLRLGESMNQYRSVLFSGFKVLIITLMLLGCAESPPTNANSSKVSGVLEEVGTEQNSLGASGAPDNPLLRNITDKLQGLGYEALGLQFENDETLLFLGSIFDSPITHDRQIRIIYTGLELSYDSKHKSLTIGGAKNLASILNFIEKNIPKRDPNDQISKIPPVWNAAPTNSDNPTGTATTLPSVPSSTTVTTSTLPNPPTTIPVPVVPSTNVQPKEVKNRSKISKKSSPRNKAKLKKLGAKPQKKVVRPESKKVEIIPSVTTTTMSPTTTTTSPILPPTTIPPNTTQVPSSTLEPTPTTILPENSDSAKSQPDELNPNIESNSPAQTSETTEP